MAKKRSLSDEIELAAILFFTAALIVVCVAGFLIYRLGFVS